MNMGHKRIGFLPKTKRWRDIVYLMGNFTIDSGNISYIAERTIDNVRSRFEFIEKDSGIHAAIKYLIYLSFAARQNDPRKFLQTHGIDIPEKATPIQLAKSVNNWISQNSESMEYAAFAKSATIDAISKWHEIHNTHQENLFKKADSFDVWRETSNGAGFCEISRFYFAKFTERYIKYFLEREASSVIRNLEDRNSFSKKLESHIDEVSIHSFEISKITQSFAAGWYNKNATKELPSDKKIEDFIAFSFNKIRAELSKENPHG